MTSVRRTSRTSGTPTGATAIRPGAIRGATELVERVGEVIVDDDGVA